MNLERGSLASVCSLSTPPEKHTDKLVMALAKIDIKPCYVCVFSHSCGTDSDNHDNAKRRRGRGRDPEPPKPLGLHTAE